MVAECLKQVNNLSRPILLCGEFSRRLSEGQLTLKSFFLVIPRSVEPGFTQPTRKAIVNRRNAIGLANSSGWLALAIHSRQRESSCLARILPPNSFPSIPLRHAPDILSLVGTGKAPFAMIPTLMSVAK